MKAILVYNDLSHPPATYLGDKYAWRKADGSHNNLSDPSMGKAGTPYARSVQQTHALPRNNLPDAGLVFDTLLKREGVRFAKLPPHICYSTDQEPCSSSNIQQDYQA